jgi:CubicO group peptidase (beta-lactamase class C family)
MRLALGLLQSGSGRTPRRHYRQRSYRYSSTATQALALLAEAASGQTWADAFDQRIWSKMGVEGPFQVHLTPDGIAMAHGLLSVRLRDMALFGMLYTPSWYKVAAEPIVTPEILERTRAP